VEIELQTEEYMKLLATGKACMRTLTAAMVFASLLSAPLTFAQTASSKATAAISTAVGCFVNGISNIGDTVPVTCHDIFSGASVDVTPDNFAQVMKATMKVSNSQSIFVSPSLVTGLYTNTKTKTSSGSTSMVTAEGAVYLRAVLRDPNTKAVVQIADPIADCTDQILGCTQDGHGDFGVVLDSRVQTLSQTLSSCVVTVAITSGTCNFDSTLQLVLQTTSAHTFNFVFPNVGVGTYTISIEAAVSASGTLNAGSGTAIAGSAYGLGSMTAESVRMVHDFSF
jgi:hypothetical protein